MHLIQIGNRVINLQAITCASFDPCDGEPLLLIGFMDDGSTTELEGEEAIALWRYITAAMHCKRIVLEPEKVD